MVRAFRLPFPRGYGLRVHRIGCSNRPFYLIGAMPKKIIPGTRPHLRPDEVIGSIDPMPNEHNEILVACDLNRLCYYLGKGAVPSNFLGHMLGLVGFYPIHLKVLVNAWRTREGKETRKGLRPTVHSPSRIEMARERQEAS